MSLFGKGYSKSNGLGRTNHYNANGKLTGHSKTNSAGVTKSFDRGGKLTKTSGGGLGRGKSGGGKRSW